MSNFQFTLSDLVSNNTSNTNSNPFYREYMKGKTGPPTTSAAFSTTAKGGSSSYDSYAGTSVLSLSDVMMNTPLQNNPNQTLGTQGSLVDTLLQGALGKVGGALGMFDALVPTDTTITSAISSNKAGTAPRNTPGGTNPTNNPSSSSSPTSGAAPGGLPAGMKVPPTQGVPVANFVNLALQQVGKQYIWGAAGPNAFDCCLVGDSMIQTVNGPVMIRDIHPDTYVYSWDEGKMVERRVIAKKAQGEQKIFEVRTRNRSVRATANHPFLVAIKHSDKKGKAKGESYVSWTFEWRRLDELKRGDLIVTYENDGTTVGWGVNHDGLTEEIAWFLGLMTGDGHVCDGGFKVCVYGQTRAKLIELCSRLWQVKGTPHPSHGVYFSNKEMQKLLESYGMRKRAPEKTVPGFLWYASNDIKAAFLKGFWDADGSHGKEGNGFNYHSSSKQLISEVRLMHVMLGDKVSNIAVNGRKKPITIKGKSVKDARPLYSFTVWFNSNRRMQSVLENQKLRTFMSDDRFGVQRIATIRALGIEETWDIEIEDSKNYIADGVVVHNSGLVMWCLQQLGVVFASMHYTGAQYDFIKQAGLDCPPSEAINIYGALLFVGNSAGPAGEHVAISLGDGKQVVEALNPQYGVLKDGFEPTSQWTAAGFVPGLDYSKITYGQGISSLPPNPGVSRNNLKNNGGA